MAVNVHPWRPLIVGAAAAIFLVGLPVMVNRAFNADQASQPQQTSAPGGAVGAPHLPAPAASPSTESPAAFDIHPLLPVSRTDLAKAADLTHRFLRAYCSWHHTETPDTYIDRLADYAAPRLLPDLRRTLTAQVIEQRRADRQVSTCRVTLTEARFIARDSVIFVATGTQHISGQSPATMRTERYALTLIRARDTWLVYALSPGDVGQAGDVPP